MPKSFFNKGKNYNCLAAMTVLIIVCMFVIYSVESLGLGNREKNVEFMITTLEKSKIV